MAQQQQQQQVQREMEHNNNFPLTHRIINDYGDSATSDDDDSYLAEQMNNNNNEEDAKLIKKCKKDIDYLFQLAGVSGVYNHRIETVSGEADSLVDHDDESDASFELAVQAANQRAAANAANWRRQEDDSDSEAEEEEESLQQEQSVLMWVDDDEEEDDDEEDDDDDDQGNYQRVVVVIDLDFEEDEDDGTVYNTLGPDRPKSDSEIDVRVAWDEALKALEILMKFETNVSEMEQERRMSGLWNIGNQVNHRRLQVLGGPQLSGMIDQLE